MAIPVRPVSPTIYYDALTNDNDEDIYYDPFDDTLRQIVSEDFNGKVPSWVLRYYSVYYNAIGTHKIYRVPQTLFEIRSYTHIDPMLVDVMIAYLEELFRSRRDIELVDINEILSEFREVMVCCPEEFSDKPEEFRAFLESLY